MTFKRTTLLPVFFFLIHCVATAQTKQCVLVAAQLPHIPELRGLYLGMTADEFKKSWPKLNPVRTNEFGTTAINIFPAFEPKIERNAFPDVKTVSLEFLDGKLTSLWLGYDESFKWQDTEAFAAGLAPLFKLPDAWNVKPRTRTLDCADFQLTISMVGQSPAIKLTDKTAQQIVDKRRAEKEAQQPQP